MVLQRTESGEGYEVPACFWENVEQVEFLGEQKLLLIVGILMAVKCIREQRGWRARWVDTSALQR